MSPLMELFTEALTIRRILFFVSLTSSRRCSASKLYKSKAFRVSRSHSVVCFRSSLIMRIFIVMALSLIALSHGNNDAAVGHFVNKLTRAINFHNFLWRKFIHQPLTLSAPTAWDTFGVNSSSAAPRWRTFRSSHINYRCAMLKFMSAVRR